MKNGELLAAAASAGFYVLVTNDQGAEHQQSIASLALRVVVLDAPSNKLRDLRARVPSTLEAIAVAIPGQVSHVVG
ncbi:MAG: hypothetical protein ACYDCC_08925 [Actinomycetota bacterium]